MKRFKKVYIEITNVCNLECDFCPRTKRKPEWMSVETFEKILDQIRGFTQYIYFHVKGEPLLHPQLDKFLDICGEKGFYANITTNGTLINRVKDMLLTKPALRQINFSLHSFDGNRMKDMLLTKPALRQMNFSLPSPDCNRMALGQEDYIENILSFIKEAVNQTKIINAIRFWNLDESNVINLERERNREILAAIERAFGLPYKIEEKITPERGMKIADRIYVNQDYQFKWPDMSGKESGAGFCYGLRNQAAILVDGTVVPCCFDGEGVISLGNINETSFGEIMESQRVARIVDGFTKREAVEALCRKCEYRKRFG